MNRLYFGSLNHFYFSFFNALWSKHQLEYLICNCLKRFLETTYSVFVNFRNFCIWLLDLQRNIFLVFIFKINMLQIQASFSRIFLTQKLYFYWRLLSASVSAESFTSFFFGHVIHKNSKLITFFDLPRLYF